MSIKEKPYCIITGAAGGIGRCLVRTFDAAGYAVIATDIVPTPQDLPYQHYLQADLARTVVDTQYNKEIFLCLSQWIPNYGLKALINNAATQILNDFEMLTYMDWQQSLNTNLLAPFIWSQSLLNSLEKSQGSIVNISSIHAHLTKKRFIAYATSKAALSGMTRAMAVDLGSRVRVNAIEPAALETSMLHSGFSKNPSAFRNLKACHPTQNIGKPEDLAAFTLSICSGELNFLNGACLTFDGGISSVLNDPENKFE